MSAPLGTEASTGPALAVAVAIGIGFGVALERAGPGQRAQLVGQFYGRDLTVFKVMFSAVVVAMLGAFWLGRAGVLDLARVYVPGTWVGPQLVGGLVFGGGMVLAGAVPGHRVRRRGERAWRRPRGHRRNVRRRASRPGWAFARLASFYSSGARGPLTLPEWLHLPDGVVVLAVVVVRARRVRRRRTPREADMSTPWRLWLAGSALPRGRARAVRGQPASAAGAPRSDVEELAGLVAREEDHVSAPQLGAWLRERRPGLRVVDVRSAGEFAAFHIPGAESVPLRTSTTRSPGRRSRSTRPAEARTRGPPRGRPGRRAPRRRSRRAGRGAGCPRNGASAPASSAEPASQRRQGVLMSASRGVRRRRNPASATTTTATHDHAVRQVQPLGQRERAARAARVEDASRAEAQPGREHAGEHSGE